MKGPSKRQSIDFRMLLACTSFFIWASCSTAYLRVQSNPDGAEVSIARRGESPVRVGKTPIDLNSNNAPGLFSDHLQVVVSKEGFHTTSLMVPKASLGAEGGLNIALKENPLPLSCRQTDIATNELAKGVAEASNLIARKRYNEALPLLIGLSQKYSTVSVLWDLQGNLYYLQRDFARALEAYRRSAILDPGNAETSRIISRLSGQSRSFASENPGFAQPAPAATPVTTQPAEVTSPVETKPEGGTGQ